MTLQPHSAIWYKATQQWFVSNAKVLINLWKQHPAELLTRRCYQTCIVCCKYLSSLHRKLQLVNNQINGSMLIPNGEWSDCLKAAISANCFNFSLFFTKYVLQLVFSFQKIIGLCLTPQSVLSVTVESAPLDLFMFWFKWFF